MILVLGGAGYIGSHAVKILIESGESVVVVDNLETGHLASVNKKAIFYQVDIRDEEALTAVFEAHDIEAILHFSANSLVGESCENPLKYFENNVYGANVLLKVMRDHDVKKIIFSSTAAVYGEPKIVPITEESETLPTNPYGESKLMMEKMFKWSDAAHGIKFVSLRYFNVAGADKSGDIGEAHTVETHLIPLVLQVPLGKREAISIYGDDYPTKDGTCIRDYIHVIDLIHAHLLALNYLRAGNESNIFNLGSGSGFSVKEVIEVAEEVTGKPIKTLIAPRRSGDPSVLIASPEKAKAILKWEPKHTNVREIIEDAWRFHINKPNGY
ncbi:UDP-glucose 4-epimerase GalE [Fusibacter ferrireducens]|uniref:UDP-glucose 4-epimerase n=1 Tax=Fusibacter ferrireducens TaxID=2785058 RepID=A0ABR9ZVX7_9FIRM|nr:UDP-glucose 4-epimerase GalE [Fusibacter ferrireducens]MBF4694616.1 UDP-glucose 4-epimerase GalE [Fusibacter ferrireducens]